MRGRVPRIATSAAVAVAALALVTSCGSDSSSWGGIKVDFTTADAAPTWSPDGRLVAFTSNRDGGGIFVVPPDGRGIRRLTATKGDNPEWSPDGKELVFEAADGIRLIAGTGENERLVLGVRKTSERELWPVWSPDGNRIAFVRETDDGSYAVFVVDRRGGTPRRLLKPALAPGDPNWSILTASEVTPAWSPDGKQIAYDSGDGVLVLATIANGRRETIPTEGAAYEPAWSPDGAKLAFQCAGNLCVFDLASRELLTLAGDAGAPSWSPDGKEVVVERYLFGAGGATSSPKALYVVADESTRRALTFGPGEVDPEE